MNSLANLFDLAIHTKCMLLTGGGVCEKNWKALERIGKNGEEFCGHLQEPRDSPWECWPKSSANGEIAGQTSKNLARILSNPRES